MKVEYKRLKDCCTKIGSGATPKGGSSVYIDSGVSLIRSQNVYNLNFSYSGLAHINDEAAKKLNGVVVNKGDVLLNITGDSVARTCVVPDDVLPARVNQHVSIIRPFKDIDSRYLNYYLASPAMQGYLLNIASTGASRNAITKAMIEKLVIPFPDFDSQRRIASILSAYDNLIENNNRRIRLLEQMAENLYKEWFVRFRFPGHEKADFENGLPKGWNYFALGDRYDITIGKTPPRKEFQWFTQNDMSAQNWMSISDMIDMFTGNTSEQLTQEAIKRFNMVVVPKNTILLSFKLTVGRITIATQPLCTNEAIAHIKNVPEIEREFLYQQLKDYEYAKLGNTSAIGNAVNSKIIKRMKIVVPNKDILLSFHKIVYPIFEQIKVLSSHNDLLSRQRDLLLPRLMSGKLEVKV